MLDLDWLNVGKPVVLALIDPKESWTGSTGWSVGTINEAGRHFFRVYGVLTRRLIFSPQTLRPPPSDSGTKSEEVLNEDKSRDLGRSGLQIRIGSFKVCRSSGVSSSEAPKASPEWEAKGSDTRQSLSEGSGSEACGSGSGDI